MAGGYCGSRVPGAIGGAVRVGVKNTCALAILTLPEGKNETLAKRLGDSGTDTLVMPALSMQPVQCDPTCLPHPEDYDLVVFVRGTAVLLYFQPLARIRPSQAWLTPTLVAQVGRAGPAFLYKTRSIPAPRIFHRAEARRVGQRGGRNG